MQQKHTFILALFTLLLSVNITHTRAATPTVSPSPSPLLSPSPSPSVDPETVTENLKKRLQETLQNESTTPILNSYRSNVGVIRDVIKDTLVVEDKDGKKKVLLKENSTLVRSPGNTTIKPDSIRIEDYIIAIGKPLEADELEATRVIVSSSPILTNTKKSELAKIVKITKNNLTISRIDSTEPFDLITNTKTVIKSTSGGSLDLTELTTGDSIIYTASETKDSLTATNIMRIGFADPDASASPLASPKE